MENDKAGIQVGAGRLLSGNCFLGEMFIFTTSSWGILSVFSGSTTKAVNFWVVL